MLYEREQGMGGHLQKKVRRTEVVWMSKERRKEDSVPITNFIQPYLCKGTP